MSRGLTTPLASRFVAVCLACVVVAGFLYVGTQRPPRPHPASFYGDDGSYGDVDNGNYPMRFRGASRAPLLMKTSAGAPPEMMSASFAAEDAAEEVDVPEARAFVARSEGAAAMVRPALGGAMSSSASFSEEDKVTTQTTTTTPEENNAMLARRANVRVSTAGDKVFTVAEAAEALAASHGGFVARSDRQNGYLDSYGHRRGRSASATLRVPVASYANAMRALLKGVGGSSADDVASASESVEDVTAEYVDVSARVKTLEASRDQLYEVLETATAVRDVLAVRAELSRVTQDLEARKSRAAYLSKEAALSTIDLYVSTKESARPPPPRPPRPSLWHAFVLRAGLTWPRFARRRFQKAAEVAFVLVGFFCKMCIVACIYGLFLLPLVAFFVFGLAPFVVRVCRRDDCGAWRRLRVLYHTHIAITENNNNTRDYKADLKGATAA